MRIEPELAYQLVNPDSNPAFNTRLSSSPNDVGGGVEIVGKGVATDV